MGGSFEGLHSRRSAPKQAEQKARLARMTARRESKAFPGPSPDAASRKFRALIYARCSTSEQDYTRQLEELRDDARRLGWDVVAEIGSYASGGSNDSDLSRIQHAAHRGEFDRLMVWELSRLTRRGIGPLLHLLLELEREKVRVWSRSETWVQDDGPTRELLLAILGWVAKWERDMISSRTKSALASRRALGVHIGRPKGARDKRPRKPRRKKEGFGLAPEPVVAENRPLFMEGR
jgi:putative DNA-invertase from lambdoid prophage Rac